MATRRELLMGIAGLAACAMLPAQAGAAGITRISGRAFGTRWSLLLPDLADGERIGRAISAMLDEIDRQMSPFRPGSQLRRVNETAGTAWQEISPELVHVAGAAQAMQQLSGGAFDPRVGPAVHRYGFGPIEGTATQGDDRFEFGEGRIRKNAPTLTLDLCGIAKGYAVDRVVGLMENEGHGDFLAEIGGEFAARGRRPDGQPWRIGIEDPVGGGIVGTVTLDKMAMATSGDRVNSFELGGRRYSHTIDPSLDAPVSNEVASVSVIARDAMTADALATALLVMGPQRGLAFAGKQDVAVLYLVRTPEGLREIDNAAFRAISQT